MIKTRNTMDMPVPLGTEIGKLEESARVTSSVRADASAKKRSDVGFEEKN